MEKLRYCRIGQGSNSTACIVRRLAFVRDVGMKMLGHQVTFPSLAGEYFAASAAIILVSRNPFV
jgi:hypothetical protein